MTDERDSRSRRSAALISPETDDWLAPKDITGPTLFFVHGFTSDGTYLKKLAAYSRAHGFVPALYNYDSYNGIDAAAAALKDRLEPLWPQLSQSGYGFVAHSMGGLVALQFACEAASLIDSLKSIVLLGVPNRGTLAGLKLVRYMLSWGEALNGPNPHFRGMACRSSQQLTRNDEGKFLESLEARVCTIRIPVLSFSGGMKNLNFGNGRVAGYLRNRALQRLIAESSNDGLVGESSADPRRAFHDFEASHHNEYSEFIETNHTDLIYNQQIAKLMMKWLSSAFDGGSKDDSSNRWKEPPDRKVIPYLPWQ